jgi:cell division protein FtsQ
MNMLHAKSLKINSMKKSKGFQLLSSLKNKLFIKIFISLVLILCTVYVSNEIYQKLRDSDFFQITEMKIDGNRMASNKQISALSKVDIHSNLLAINVPQVKSLLESHPWIDRVVVTRNWPNRLLITVKEKKPVAILNRDTGLFYLDKKGLIIAVASPSQELDFPVITGLESFHFNSTNSAQTNDIIQDVMALLKLAARKNSTLPEQNISEINITKNNEMILYLLERTFPIYMGAGGDISTKYNRLAKVLRNLYKTKEFSKVSYIRLDYQKDTILVGKKESDRKHRG